MLEDREPTPEEKKEELRLSLNIISWEHTFENFKTVKDAMASLKAFKELADGSSWYILLNYGSNGCGKSYMCDAFSINLAKRNIRCKRWKWTELIRDFKCRLRSGIPGDYDRFFDTIRNLPYLVLDDVVMVKEEGKSNWEWAEFDDIIDYRWEKRLVTIVTTNLDITHLPPRSVSRFRDAVTSRMILNKAEDYRPKRR
ncbi:hypothetical protein LCGC14_2153320 [marine sediment metagenome]|uniref:Uncharacterized protein n=1 Tax=marine sediment metagenome TaxID=412755 RepID=A0A0F9GR91_9ZZZZ